MKALRKYLLSTVLAAMVVTSAGPVGAAGAKGGAGDSDGPEAVLDLVFVRPFLAIQSAIGLGMFVIAAPFAMADGKAEDAANALMTTPFKKLFSPLGQGYSDDDK